jgi:hypothetical protein
MLHCLSVLSGRSITILLDRILLPRKAFVFAPVGQKGKQASRPKAHPTGGIADAHLAAPVADNP